MWRRPSDKALLVSRLTLSLLCAVLNGINLSYNVYNVALKQTFNFTQTQVEFVATSGCVGFGLTILEVFITGLFGYTTTFVLTWIMLPASCVVHSLACLHPSFVHNWPILVYVNQVFLYMSSAVACVLVTRVCLEIIPPKMTGTFLGLFGAGLCFGKIFYAAIFQAFFLENLSGFFVCLSVMFAVTLGTCYVLLYPVAMSLQKPPEDDAHDGEMQASPQENGSGYVFKSLFFHMIFWTNCVFSAAGYTVLDNITFVTDSLGMPDPFVPVTTMSVCIMTTRFLFGFIFDRFSSQTTGFVLLFITYLSFGTGLVIGMWFLNTTSVHLLTVLTGFGIGPSVHLPLAMLVVQYGRSYYSYLSAGLYGVMAMCQVLTQPMVGFLYDSKKPQTGITNTCLGDECFFLSFVVLFIITLTAMVIQTVSFLFKAYYPSFANKIN